VTVDGNLDRDQVDTQLGEMITSFDRLAAVADGKGGDAAVLAAALIAVGGLASRWARTGLSDPFAALAFTPEAAAAELLTTIAGAMAGHPDALPRTTD